LRTRSRHACGSWSASSPLSARSHGFWPRVGPVPRVSPLNSQVAFYPQASGPGLGDRRRFGRFSRVLPRPRVLPGTNALFVPPFGVFFLARPAMRVRQTRPPVLMHSSNRIPSGNCDSPRLETCLNYLTRFGAVSYRSWSLSSFSRGLTTRERRQRNW
jgi:hypothetical protein